MSLHITLINARPFYYPGDEISGHVTLDSKKSEDIAQVLIDFTGRCKVKIRRHDHYTTISHRTRGYYFRQSGLIYHGGSYTFQSGIRSWPFSFTIPLEAGVDDPRAQRPASKRELDKLGIMKKNDLEGLESDHFSSSPTWRGSYDNYRGRPDPHYLPDTFEYVSNRFPASCEARVEYELTATLKRPTRGVLFPAKDLEVLQDIILRSRNRLQSFPSKNENRASPETETQTVSIPHDFAAAHLASSQKMSKITKAAMNVFKPSDLRPVNVDISVALNRYLRPSGPCALLLQISMAATGYPAIFVGMVGRYQELAPVRLQSYTLRLLARTALRGKQESVMVQDVNHYAVDGRTLLAGKSLDVVIPRNSDRVDDDSGNEGPNLTEVGGWLDLSAPFPLDEGTRQFVTPTFKTYNINREYELSLEMRVECTGIKYDIKSDNVPVTILAEEDYPEIVKKDSARRDAEQMRPPSMDRKEQSDNQPSTDEKKGSVPPPPREEEPEALPKYEPGDVPDYQANHEQ